MMKSETFAFPSATGKHTLHGIAWIPDGPVRAIMQISHGMVEYIERYQPLAEYLTEKGILVVGHDHVGHGQSVSGPDEWGHFSVKNGGRTLVEDLHTLTLKLRRQVPGIPLFLMGHSMGSFVARRYMMTYGRDIDGAIVMGTGNQPTYQLLAGQMLTALLTRLYGEGYRSPLMARLLFSRSNRRIPQPRTENDWLTKDTGIVDRYRCDPACSFRFTLNGYANLFALIRYVKKPAHIAAIPRDLPVILLSGEDDPVGDYGRAVQQVYESLKKRGLTDLTIKLYPEDRHELINETDRETVFKDIGNWLEQHRKVRREKGREHNGY